MRKASEFHESDDNTVPDIQDNIYCDPSYNLYRNGKSVL